MLVTLAAAALATLAPLTAPPNSTEPDDAVSLDGPRQEIVDDLVSLGIMRDQPVEPYCLAPLVAAFPDAELDSLAANVVQAIDVEISDGALEPVVDPLTEAEADLAYDSLVCVAGDADAELVAEAVSSLSDDEDFADWDLDCARATLTVFPDGMLEDVADGDDPRDVRRRFDDRIDDASDSTSEEDVDELTNHVTSFFFCAPNGRELIGDGSTASSSAPSTTEG